MILSIFETLELKPDSRIVAAMAILGLVLLVPLKINVDSAFARSGYPVGFVQSQLSFSGDVIRSHFHRMNQAQLVLYRKAQFVDYAFLTVYGFAFSFLSLFAGRLFRAGSIMRKAGSYFAVVAILAAFCDALENLFILLMLTDPEGFPAIFAIIHSCFATAKFLLIGLSALYTLSSLFFKAFAPLFRG